MAGRKARVFHLSAQDKATLEALLRQSKTEYRVVRRARILVEMDRGTPVGKVSGMVGMDPATVWRVCRRYETRGLQAIYDAPRSGRRPRRVAEPSPL